MKKVTNLLLLGSLLFCGLQVNAQKTDDAQSAGLKNVIKVNLTGLILNNYYVQYERVIKRRMSVALGVSIMPKSGLPFEDKLMEEFGHNADAKRAIETTKLSNISITPEVRFYMGRKAAPAGFYIAPYLRYTHTNFEQLYEFTASNNQKYRPLIGGNIDYFGLGLLFGSQWNLGKKLTLDWWIMGASIGSIKGNLTGTDNSTALSPADQQQLKKDIEDVDLPLINKEATVGANTTTVKLSGSSLGLRGFGIALGYRF